MEGDGLVVLAVFIDALFHELGGLKLDLDVVSDLFAFVQGVNKSVVVEDVGT